MYHQHYVTDSGEFVVDHGELFLFIPNITNMVVTEDKERVALRHLLFPEQGIESIRSGMFRDLIILDSVQFPDGLSTIGDINGLSGGVFVHCQLPRIVLPSSIRMIGDFCFASCSIAALELPTTNLGEYARQFKDSTIGELRLPCGTDLGYLSGVLQSIRVNSEVENIYIGNDVVSF